MKPITIIKNRSDIGAGTRGSDLGIDAIEIAAINQHNGFFNEHPFVDVPSHNETIYNKKFFEMKHRLGFVFEQCQRVCNSVSEILKQNQFPLILSGDHSSAFGSLAGIQKAYPDKTIGVLSQKEFDTEEPVIEDLNVIGTVAHILKMLKMPDGNITAVIQGRKRFFLNEIISSEPYYKGKISELKEVKPIESDDEFDALVDSVKDLALKIIEESPNIPTEASIAIKNIKNTTFAINFISSTK